MTSTVQPMIHEAALPGDEHTLQPRPEWRRRYCGSDRLKGKVAIVTGGDSGIGRAVAALYAREGADVAIAYLLEDEDAAETCAMIEAEGLQAMRFRGDLGDRDTCRELVRKVVKWLGRIDVLVNNAGEQHADNDIADITEEQLIRTFQTNILGMFYLVQAALPHMGKGGVIVNTTSITSYQGSESLLDYSATKGAITAFTLSLSKNLLPRGIRVNAVAPGPVWMPLNPSGGADPDKMAHFGESTPMKRAGQPNEIAPSYLFLACEDSSYMTGQVLHPNGGTAVGG
jgi:NAD(P)-dependent dehydrogenase (short-subunit alcohol dehydrogenase family)